MGTVEYPKDTPIYGGSRGTCAPHISNAVADHNRICRRHTKIFERIEQRNRRWLCRLPAARADDDIEILP